MDNSLNSLIAKGRSGTDALLGIDGNEINTLAKVNRFMKHFEEYKLVCFDSPWKERYKELIEKYPDKKDQLELEASKHEKEWYLLGLKPTKQAKEYSYSNPDILISLVNLAAKIIKHNGLAKENGEVDELAFSDEITEWCKIYGLPYTETYFQQNYCKERKPIPPLGYSAFRMWEFKRQIAVLHDRFQLWYGLAYDDIRKIIEYAKGPWKINNTDDLDEKIMFIKDTLSYDIWAGMRTEIGLKYNKDTDLYEIIPYTDSVVSIAYFQLAMLMTNKGTKGVKFCTMCGRLFPIEHAGREICDPCKKEYHRIKMQESRRKNGKKGGKKHV